MAQGREYAQAGVDYTKLKDFKDMMAAVGRRTFEFPNKRGVFIEELAHPHGVVFEYAGHLPHRWCKTLESLGNKNWIAEWMYQNAGTGRTYYEGIGIDTALMAVNDVITQAAMPVTCCDIVAAGDSDWFTDRDRSKDLAESFFKICQMTGMAFGAGDSPSLRYLIRAELPVQSAPVLFASVSGIIAPKSRMITGDDLKAGDRIIGVTSSGLHANGISLVIKRAMTLPDQFLTELPNGNILGDEALIPTRSYVDFVEALLDQEVEVHAFLPGTGDGVAKLAFDKRPFTYRVHTWVREIPPLFLFMLGLGISLKDCLTTFNWGIGYYAFVPPRCVDRVIEVGAKAGYEVLEVGIVEEGERMTIFGPEGDLILPPPGE